jgi:hypothetical protein
MPSRPRTRKGGRLAATLAVALVMAGAALPAYGRDAPARPRPVVFDSDMDFDDSAALAALAQQHLTGRSSFAPLPSPTTAPVCPARPTGTVAACSTGSGLAEVPVADATYDLPHAFPDFLRAGVDAILDASIDDCAAGGNRPPTSAGELIADVLARAPDG